MIITKTKFEDKLYKKNNYNTLTYCTTKELLCNNEGNFYQQKLTLYYNDNGKHIGTWVKGKGFIIT
jgi:hypothetical protein